MSRHTTYGIGGPAAAYVIPADRHDLATVLRYARQEGIPVTCVGSGSNLLVADQGFDGIVITLGKSFTRLEFHGTHVYAEAGVMLGHLVRLAARRNLAGLESMIGVPGTIGGALVMNAGAFGGEISNYLTAVEVMTLAGETKTYPAEAITFGYRHSSFADDEIILAAEFDLVRSTPETIKKRLAEASRGRKSTQPLRFRSAGSVFKNPRADLAAGYLIDRAGLKGTRIGAAEISPHHANFFINHGQATAADVVQLIRLARERVQAQFGIRLELEIKTLGFKPGELEA
jgi:UDP-N-acetylmuramate dehydrogenase